jgi:hypothetical protein
MEEIIVDQDQIQTSIRLPKELLKRAKKYAIDNDTSLAFIVIDSLEAYLDKKNGGLSRAGASVSSSGDDSQQPNIHDVLESEE